MSHTKKFTFNLYFFLTEYQYMAAPGYGTNEDLKRVFSEVHKRGMHLILDLVLGHTSVECKWFQESMKLEKNAYTHRYIWTDNIWEGVEGIKNITGSIRGISNRNESCTVNFFPPSQH